MEEVTQTVLDMQEQLLEAIQLLIDHGISRIQSDKTVICTITDNSDRDNGHYKVTKDGSIIYDAYSEKTTYLKDEQVIVQMSADTTIPKMIVSRYLDAKLDAKPIGYVSQKNKILPDERLIFSIQNRYEIPISPGGGTLINIPFESNLPNSNLYNAIYIKADFQCNIEEQDIRSGNYGLALILQNGDSAQWEYILDSSIMFGNPYRFSVPYSQEILYNYKSTEDLKIVGLQLYQMGNFKHFTGDGLQSIKCTQDINGAYISPVISVSNIEINFGMDVEAAVNRTIDLKNLSGDDGYDGGEGSVSASKQVQLFWYNKTEQDKYLGFNDGVFDEKARYGRAQLIPSDDNKWTIRVNNKRYVITEVPEDVEESAYVYYVITNESDNEARCEGVVLSSEQESIYYAIDWYRSNASNSLEQINTNDTINLQKVTVECSAALSKTTVKGVLWCNGEQYIKEITFTNRSAVVKQEVDLASIVVHIEHGENSQSAYPLYSSATNTLIDSFNAKKPRTVYFTFSSAESVAPSLWDNAKIEWILNGPMLAPVDETQQQQVISVNDAGTMTGHEFQYLIGESFITTKNQTIQCKITAYVQGVPISFITEIPIDFGLFGASGTDYTIIFSQHFDSEGDPSHLQIKICDTQGELVELNPNRNLFSDTPSIQIRRWWVENSQWETLTQQEDGFIITSADLPTTSETYNLLEVKAPVQWNNETVWIYNYYQYVVPAAESQCYATVPSVISYDNTGANPTYNSDAWELYTSDHKKVENVSWSIKEYGKEKIFLPYADSQALWGNVYRGENGIVIKETGDSVYFTTNNIGVGELINKSSNLYYLSVNNKCPYEVFLNVSDTSGIAIKTICEYNKDSYPWLSLFDPSWTQEAVSDESPSQKETVAVEKTIPLYISKHRFQRIYFSTENLEVDSVVIDDTAYLDGMTPSVTNAGQPTVTLSLQSFSAKKHVYYIDPMPDVDEKKFMFMHFGIKIMGTIQDSKKKASIQINVQGADFLLPSSYLHEYRISGDDPKEIGFYNMTFIVPKEEVAKYPNERAFLQVLSTFNPLGKNSDSIMTPLLTEDYGFQVPSLFVENGTKTAIEARVGGELKFNIPIHMFMRQHDSQLFNQWDGAQIIDSENNIALAAMLGAGIKNSNNTFSGVVMGERRKIEDGTNMSDIGIFGFDNGIQSYEFNINGTARLGAPGGGQIVFDGNRGVIASANWFDASNNLKDELSYGNGLKIDLSAGTINAKTDKSNELKFDSRGLTVKGTINGGVIKSLEWEGETDDTGAILSTSAGTAIDLTNGYLSTAGFTLGGFDQCQMSIDVDNGLTVKTQNWQNITVIDDNVAYYYSIAKPTRKTHGALNIRRGPGKSHSIIGSYDFTSLEVPFYFKNAGNKAISANSSSWREHLATNNNWLPIMVKAVDSNNKKKYIPITSESELLEEPLIGYIYYQGTEGKDLFNYIGPGAKKAAANVKQGIAGTYLQIDDADSQIIISKSGSTLENQTGVIRLGNGCSSPDYALEIGAFKVTWSGEVKLIGGNIELTDGDIELTDGDIELTDGAKRRLILTTSSHPDGGTKKNAIYQRNDNNTWNSSWAW